MALEYFCCYHSYRKKLAKLSDQEVGRLFRSLLEYSETGETQELTGRESVAFDFISDDIDRAKERYAEKCRINRENASDRKRTPATASDRKRTLSNDSESSQDKDKDKTKNKDNSPPKAPQPEEWGFGEALTDAFSQWLAYKREKRQEYKPTGLKALVTQVRKYAEQYGEAAVADLIQTCMSSNWQGIIWDRLDKAPVSHLPGQQCSQNGPDWTPIKPDQWTPEGGDGDG